MFEPAGIVYNGKKLDLIKKFPPSIPVFHKFAPFRKEIVELATVGFLMTHEGLVVDLIFNELFMVICVGETSIGKSVDDWTFNCSFIFKIVVVVSELAAVAFMVRALDDSTQPSCINSVYNTYLPISLYR